MKILLKYYKKRKSNIDSILARSTRKYTPGTFHKLRIEIKKLNALFDLINFSSKDFKQKKYFKPYKLIFQQAGKVRELQLEEEMLIKQITNNSLNNYRNSITKNRLKEQDNFYLIVNNESTNGMKIKYHKIVPFLKKANNRKANHYLEKKKNIIKKVIGQGPIETQQVHKLRKRLKMLNYNINSLLVDDRKQVSKNLDILPDLLGQWHDCQLMTQHLEKAMEDIEMSLGEIHQLEIIKSKIDSDSEILFNKINKAIPEHQHILNKALQQIHQ